MSELSELMAAINDSDRVTYMKPFPLPNESQTRALIAAMNRHRDEAATLRTRAEEAEARVAEAERTREAQWYELTNIRLRGGQIKTRELQMAADRVKAAEVRVAELEAEVAHLRRVEAGAVRQADELAAMRGVVDAARRVDACEDPEAIESEYDFDDLRKRLVALDALTGVEG